MNKLKNNININLFDLPNEILLIIIKKLQRIDVLSSLIDVHPRFDQLIIYSINIDHHLDLTNIMNNNVIYDQISSINNQFIRKISLKILPNIQNQIHKLTIEQDSIEQILSTNSYHHLYSLSLINCQEDILYQDLTGI